MGGGSARRVARSPSLISLRNHLPDSSQITYVFRCERSHLSSVSRPERGMGSAKRRTVSYLAPAKLGLDSIEKIRVQDTLVLDFDRAAMLALELVLDTVICAFG